MKTRGKVQSTDLIIGLVLKNLRKEKRLSRNALAPLVGVSGQQIAKYESGDNRIAVSTLLNIVGVLGMTISEFMIQFDREKIKYMAKEAELYSSLRMSQAAYDELISKSAKWKNLN